MAPWSFHSAASLVFGRGSLAQLPDRLVPFRAKKILVITDATLQKVGIVESVVSELNKSGATVEIFSGCLPEPPVEVILEAAGAANSFRPDLLVGLGGGSNMDAAKLVAVLLAHGGQPTDWVGDSRVPGPIFPLVCIPTTAGTGSEVSAAAVFTDTAQKIKVSTLSPFIRPALAVVDPALTDNCPKQVTADSGIDALTHAIEAYTAVDHSEFVKRPGGATVYQGKNPLADAMASECIRLVGRFLKRAVNTPGDTEARDGMMLAGTLGGLAFSNAGVALVHAMEYPVGGAVHVSHGAGNGLLLPYIMKFNHTVRAKQIEEIGTWLGANGDAIASIEQLRRDIGIPTRLRDIGVKEEMLPAFAEKAFAIKRLMRVNPRTPQSATEILGIYRAAF